MREFNARQKQVLDLVRQPAEALLASYGIKTKKASQGYFNVSRCPWCSHGDDKKSNFQCGVRESQGDRGLVHSYKCMHPHDSPDGDDTPAWADVLAALGAMSAEEAAWVKGLRKRLDEEQRLVQVKNSTSGLGLANVDFNARLHRRLQANQTAMDWLLKTRGYKQDVIDYFKLGLSEPYTPEGAKEPLHSDALAAPLLDRDGKFKKKYVNYAIPGVTLDRREKAKDDDKPRKSWSPGPTRAYYSGKADGKKRLFVCDGLKDLWAIWSAIKGTDLERDLLLMTSTNGGGAHPEEWKVAGFWEPWEVVYLGHDNDAPNPKTGKKAGDEHAKKLAQYSMREMRRVWPVGFKDWNDFFLAGRTVKEFEQLLAEGYVLSLKDIKNAEATDEEGFHAADPVSIAGAFHNGYLYEAVKVLERERDTETGQMGERYRTVVVRSDGTLHHAVAMPAPKGTPQDQIVHRLVPDGSLLDGPIKGTPSSTWSWQSINKFISGSAKQKPLRELLSKINGHLRASIWLPFEDDYTLLACTVVATYVQSVFDAVPLLLATGAPGSGKTQLGIAMGELSANCPKTAVGQISAASIARLIDQTRGFVVLDDLESVGTRKNGDAQFDELVQSLKLSYNKMSAVKFWTNMKTGKLEKLNFFGIKLINNTRGVDEILGSRMMTIATRKMPEGHKLVEDGLLSPAEREELRNDLHVWAFSNVGAVAQTYAMVFPNKTTRADEISAPLKVIATLSGEEAVASSLERALEHQVNLDVLPETPEQILREALERILLEAMREDGVIRTVVTVTEVIMQMAVLVDTNFGKRMTNELSDIESPEWVGRQLRQNYMKMGAEQIRLSMYEKYLRGYRLHEEFVDKMVAKGRDQYSGELQRNDDPRAFCKGCASCPYRSKCDMREVREAKEGTKTNRPGANGRLHH